MTAPLHRAKLTFRAASPGHRPRRGERVRGGARLVLATVVVLLAWAATGAAAATDGGATAGSDCGWPDRPIVLAAARPGEAPAPILPPPTPPVGATDPLLPVTWRYWLGTLGFGAIAGWSVGYTVKKVAKLAALVLGVGFITVQYLAYNQLVVVDWHQIENRVPGGSLERAGEGLLGLLTYNLPFGGAFLVGFFAGFRSG